MLVFQLQEGRGLRSLQIRERMAGPLPTSVTDELADDVMRRGPGSTQDQFARQTEMGARSSRRWKRTAAFGNRPAPTRTLHRTGALEAAWTGGPGAITERGPRGVAIGVDRVRFPQASVFQRSGLTPVRVTSKSRIFLGMEFGVWLKASTRRMFIEGRPLSVNPVMLERARRVIVGYYVRGEAVSSRRAA